MPPGPLNQTLSLCLENRLSDSTPTIVYHNERFYYSNEKAPCGGIVVVVY
jgi:hypothetical protein